MRAGGRTIGRFWAVRVRTLQEGDLILADSWDPNYETWWGGSPYFVVTAEATGLRDGFWYVTTFDDACPSQDRVFAMRPDDSVILVQREVKTEVIDVSDYREEIGGIVVTYTNCKKPKKQKQMKLF